MTTNNKTFTLRNNMGDNKSTKYTILENDGKKTFECGFLNEDVKCEKMFDTDVELKNHIKSSHFGKHIEQFICENCNEVLPSKKKLREHILARRHFQCSECAECFDNERSLSDHVQTCWEIPNNKSDNSSNEDNDTRESFIDGLKTSIEAM